MPSVFPATNKRRGGTKTVNYVLPNGRTTGAVVTGPGTAGTLNLKIRMLPVASRNKTDVAKRTSVAQTGVWF